MLRAARINRIALVLLAFGASYPAAVSAQEGGPLLKTDLVRMMTASNYTSTEMAAIVRMKCVGFEPTERDRSQLLTLPGAELVMAEVDRCVSKPRPAAGLNRGVVRTKSTQPVEDGAVQIPPKPTGQIQLIDLDIEPIGTPLPELRAPPTATVLPTAEIPSLASRQTQPRLTNWDEVTTAFLYEYRPRVRSPGTVVLTLRIGSDGSVLEAAVKQATGDPAMAKAALRITGMMKFRPAMMRDQAVESLTELPIHFATN